MISVYLCQTKNPWTWHTALYELALYYKETKNCNLIISEEKGFFKKYNYVIPDCEIIIYDEKNDILKAVSFKEQKSGLLKVFQERNNKSDILVIAQSSSWFQEAVFQHEYADKNKKSLYNFSIKQSSFFPLYPKLNLNFWRIKRKLYQLNNNLISDKMFFLCSTGRGDIKKLTEKNLITKKETNFSYEEYMENAIKYKIGLSISGGQYEVCHRDIEYMALGLPILHLEYINPLFPELKPNYHYISVPRGNLLKNPWTDLYGGDEYVEAYEKRFKEVVNDDDFLNFISKNAFEYYNNYCSPQNRIKILLEQLEL